MAEDVTEQAIPSAQRADPPECLEVAGLVRTYSSEIEIGPISFSVKEGEFFSLLGPSGCGKSTVLRAIAGFERVDEGAIYLRGEPIHHKPPNKRDVGLVFQRYALFPHLSVHDNVAFGLRQRRMPSKLIKVQVDAALELVGLSGMGDRWPGQLSGGQQQRVALARSLVLEPPLLLLDEPLSSLDLKLRVQMREELRNLQSRLHKTTIFVTHDQTEALSMSDRLAVLSNGKIEQIGTPRQVYNEPASPFVARFIGSTNQFVVTHVEYNGADADITTEEGLRLRVGSSKNVRVGALLFIRPERVQLSTEKSAHTINTFEARIVGEQYLGDDVQLRVKVGEGAELLVAKKVVTNAEVMRRLEPCQITIDPDAIYVI